MAFWPHRDYVRARWLAYPDSAFAAEADGELVGSNFSTHWGSVGFFGPLTVRPDFWDKGIAKCLLERTMELFQKWSTRQQGLFTFAQSPKHIHLYQKFGFWPRFLTQIMSKSISSGSLSSTAVKFSELPESQRSECLAACRELTNTICEGLDLEKEIRAVEKQSLGETMFLWDDSRLDALAVCHCGAGTEAGSGTCYVKFGAVRPDSLAQKNFDRLLQTCEALAGFRGLSRLEAGVNTARHHAYRKMMERGFRTEISGVAMQRPNEAGYNQADIYLIDDSKQLRSSGTAWPQGCSGKHKALAVLVRPASWAALFLPQTPAGRIELRGVFSVELAASYLLPMPRFCTAEVEAFFVLGDCSFEPELSRKFENSLPCLFDVIDVEDIGGGQVFSRVLTPICGREAQKWKGSSVMSIAVKRVKVPQDSHWRALKGPPAAPLSMLVLLEVKGQVWMFQHPRSLVLYRCEVDPEGNELWFSNHTNGQARSNST